MAWVGSSVKKDDLFYRVYREGIVKGAGKNGKCRSRKCGATSVAPENLEITVFEMLAEIAWIQRFARGVGDQCIGREAAAMLPDILL